MLLKCFTQNIDGLERLTGLSDHMIVEAHGSFTTCHCLECGSETSGDVFMVRLNESPSTPVKCLERSCVGNATAYVKPDIVFFGEPLPRKFFSGLSEFSEADLLIILGTSLQVQPFASLISAVPPDCPRLFINLEPAEDSDFDGDPGGFDFEGLNRGGKKYIRDVFFHGTTDEGVEELCDLLGWKDELLQLHESTSIRQTSQSVDDPKNLSQVNNKMEETILVNAGNSPHPASIPSMQSETKMKEDQDASTDEHPPVEIDNNKDRETQINETHGDVEAEESQESPIDELTTNVNNLSLSRNL